MNDSQVLEVQEVREERSSTAPEAGSGRAPLFADNERENFRSRWQEIQGNFVDEPRRAVEQADQLVDSIIKRLTDVLTVERNTMEKGYIRVKSVISCKIYDAR